MKKYPCGRLFAMSLLASTAASPALAQEGSASAEPNSDIIVTAQRIEQRLQDVPISISVFDQEGLSNNNVTSPRDLASLTPGLAVSTRFGSDATTFTIRGFSQEFRTTSTVATYFADVVAPRGSGANIGGDGAVPGQLFDLQNVQVLKGPQGTLFGRNTTGGAVLLVPVKPTDRLEGYLEGTLGNFDSVRVQGALNIPVDETFRLRVGVDRNRRDGYLRNVGLGPKDLGDINYTSVRVSAVADLSPDVENYTIVSYTNSDNNGVASKLYQAFPGTTPSIFGLGVGGSPTWGTLAQQQIDREAGQGRWTVANGIPDTRSFIEQWQIINTTTWQASDNLTLKNNFAYGEFRSVANNDLYGNFFPIGVAPGQVADPSQLLIFAAAGPESVSGLSNAQSSLVEELQLIGTSSNGRLNWQAGVYFESNKPIGFSGVQSPNYTGCADILNFVCNVRETNVSAGAMSFIVNKTTFRSLAAYAQASYNLTDKFTVTAGIRYTDDKSSSDYRQQKIIFPAAGAPYVLCSNTDAPGFTGSTPSGVPISERFTACAQTVTQKSNAPTWLLGVDFKPIDDVLLYAKYTRGYRMGSVVPAAPSPFNTFKPEKLDAYEAGVKASWGGTIPGTFNLSGFYNKFSNQQLQVGLFTLVDYSSLTTYIANVAKSRVYGLEADLRVSPFEGVTIGASYAYLDTRVQEVGAVTTPPGFLVSSPSLKVGGELPFAVPHKLVVDASATLPFVPERLGKVTIGGNVIYQSSYLVNLQAHGTLPSYTWGNANLSWEGIAGSPLDASLFVTNITNKLMYTSINDQSSPGVSAGFLSASLAEPRIWGVRLRYRFGE